MNNPASTRGKILCSISSASFLMAVLHRNPRVRLRLRPSSCRSGLVIGHASLQRSASFISSQTLRSGRPILAGIESYQTLPSRVVHPVEKQPGRKQGCENCREDEAISGMMERIADGAHSQHVAGHGLAALGAGASRA